MTSVGRLMTALFVLLVLIGCLGILGAIGGSQGLMNFGGIGCIIVSAMMLILGVIAW